MHARSRCAADQQRNMKSLALHFLGYVGHFLERRRDQAGQTDDIGVFFARGLEYFLRGHHDAEIDDVEIIALKYDGNDVLADVVYVTLDRGNDDLALAPAGGA